VAVKDGRSWEYGAPWEGREPWKKGMETGENMGLMWVYRVLIALKPLIVWVYRV
jgi:hypothetical protein